MPGFFGLSANVASVTGPVILWADGPGRTRVPFDLIVGPATSGY